jgi:hypothetical protein
LDAENAEQEEMKRSRRRTNMHETNARAQRNTRELHLELGGDKVTYVRVY